MSRANRPKRDIKLATIRVILPKLFSLALEERRTLALGTLALAVGSFINLLFPALVRKFLNGDFGSSITEHLTEAAVVLVLLFAIQSTSFYLRHLLFLLAGLRSVRRLRSKLFSELIRKEISFFDSSRSADLLTRLTSDCQMVQNAVSTNISVFLRYAIQVIGGLVLMALISGKLTLVIGLTIPFIVLGIKLWGKKLQTASRAMQEALSQLGVTAGERLAGVRVVRIFSSPEREMLAFEKANAETLERGIERGRVAALFSSVMVFVVHTAIAFIFFFGAQMVIKAELQIGDLAAFLLYCAIVSASFGFLVGVIDDLLGAIGGASRVFELIEDTKRANIDYTVAPTFKADTPHFTFNQVGFSYGGVSTRTELKDISFTVNEGETIAVVGPSGAGKTTLLSLLARFYAPTTGEIEYRGVPYSGLPIGVVESEIAIVTQEPILFSSTLRENILFARPSASKEELDAAVLTAQLLPLVESLPNGLETEIGERGIKLSGGERQRLSIARAVLKNAKLLILDEPTSALDSENEHLVQEALAKAMTGRTTIIVAHRLSTIQHSDRILVLQNGKIVETGDHKSLTQSNGLYASLVRYQLL